MMGADMSVAHRQSILHLTSHANIPAELTKRKPEFMSKTVAPLLFLSGWTMSPRMALGFVVSLSAILQVSQDYPSKPVRMIEPFGAGGGPDLIARAISPKLSELWGQPVIVDNHPGAGSTVAPALVAKSPADGYTLLVNTSALAYSAALLKNLPYDPLKDFTPVAPLTSQPYVLVACKSTGITTIGELIAAAKAKPGKLKFGSAGLGTATHFGGREIQSRDSHQGSTRARRHDPSSDRR